MWTQELKELWDELDQTLFREVGISSRALEHALHPRNEGTIADPDGEASLTGICEESVCIRLRVRENQIEDIRFTTNGCAATTACGSILTELAQGLSVREAVKIDGAQIIKALGGLPVEHTHCAELAANTLKAALRNALEHRKEPWKKLYRPKG
jgi:nitrogen fixation protein NifU and related proteins